MSPAPSAADPLRMTSEKAARQHGMTRGHTEQHETAVVSPLVRFLGHTKDRVQGSGIREQGAPPVWSRLEKIAVLVECISKSSDSLDSLMALDHT